MTTLEEEITRVITLVCVKAGVRPEVQGAMCHEVRTIIESLAAEAGGLTSDGVSLGGAGTAETPATDRHTIHLVAGKEVYDDLEVVTAEFARQLERQLLARSEKKPSTEIKFCPNCHNEWSDDAR